ncbi:iron-containing alcohol dehydrogenase [Butyrivibrio sp. NC3005]|uniref:iron-containing alcohol dehydrogenase n=1 Tax=Butyrivibrio sp. NC3005 TaxID=1280685 RepID=UPI0004091188|nr:iron-containing alcohol dehydrogenase [Butyrivibrio sp. NC3005]
MESFEYQAPTKVIFGKNAEEKIGAEVKNLGMKKALLVYGGGSVIKSGLMERVEKSLEGYEIEYVEFGGVKPNPTVAHAKEGIKLAVKENIDIVIGVGGGSTIDTAKAIAHGTANKDVDLWDIWSKKVPVTKSLPVGAVLTIPAAGSEMSDSAVLTNEELGKKSGINTPFNRCKFAIMNPELAFTLPKYQLFAGITDIMMHTMERYFIPGISCQLTDELAEGLLRTVISNAKILMENQENYDAMAEIMWAGSLSHNNLMELGRGKDFSVHKFGHALSAKYDVTHGASLSAVWGAWANELYMGAADRFARFARKVWGIEESDEVRAAQEGIKKTVEFFSLIGMPTSISGLGLNPSKEEIGELALLATANGTMKLSRIRPLDTDDAKKIFEMAR